MPRVSQMAVRHFRRWHLRYWCSSIPCWSALAFYLVVLTSCSQAVIPHDLVVQTQKGKVRGVTLKSATNKYDNLSEI